MLVIFSQVIEKQYVDINYFYWLICNFFFLFLLKNSTYNKIKKIATHIYNNMYAN